MFDVKISVIIPIYCVENYINTCVESVVTQSYSNTEIILIDDGSPDNCPTLCDFWAKRDDRIIVIHKENGGLSDARNAGIKASSGDYVIFLDGDDFWDDSDALLKLINRLKITNADVLNFSYKKIFIDTNEKVPYFNNISPMPTELVDKNRQLSFLVKNRLYIASACNKIIRRALFDSDLTFEKDVYSEDIEWCARLMLKSNSMDFICENFYCYRQRRDSITHTINYKKCHDLCNNILKCFVLLENANNLEVEALSAYIAYQYGTFFKVQALTETTPRNCIDSLACYSGILSYHNNDKRLLLLNILCKIFGFKFVCKVIRTFYKIRRRK